MTKGRLEAFSDGVIAIIITIMVLELKVPHEATPEALIEIWPVFLSYILSFIYVGIYWTNHHHLYHAVHNISGGVLWANLHLLFWLSLTPFVTGWMGENHFRAGSGPRVRLRPADVRRVVHHPAAVPAGGAGTELDAGQSRWPRLEGKHLAADLRCGDRAGVRGPADQPGWLCHGRRDLVHSRQADRTRSAGKSLNRQIDPRLDVVAV